MTPRAAVGALGQTQGMTTDASGGPSERGRHNSSITRVRPFFMELIGRDPTGESWLGPLLRAAPHAGRLPPGLADAPGVLLPEVVARRPYEDRVLGATVELEGCFEHAVPPPEHFLRWMIENAERLRWPQGGSGARRTYGENTTERREALLAGDAAARDEALAALAERGARGSGRRWWAFEGFTSVDCLLATDRLVLFIEGKRTETLSASNDWFPGRNQLVRNLEAAGELAGGRAAHVLLVTEDDGHPGLRPEHMQESLPHLDAAGRDALLRRYLGQTTWARLGEALDVPPERLPDTTAGARERLRAEGRLSD